MSFWITESCIVYFLGARYDPKFLTKIPFILTTLRGRRYSLMIFFNWYFCHLSTNEKILLNFLAWKCTTFRIRRKMFISYRDLKEWWKDKRKSREEKTGGRTSIPSFHKGEKWGGWRWGDLPKVVRCELSQPDLTLPPTPPQFISRMEQPSRVADTHWGKIMSYGGGWCLKASSNYSGL